MKTQVASVNNNHTSVQFYAVQNYKSSNGLN